MEQPPLKALHAESTLSELKLEQLRKLPTAVLIESLRPDQPGPLTARSDGTMLNGHHRIVVLRERGVDVNSLPREVLTRDAEEED